MTQTKTLTTIFDYRSTRVRVNIRDGVPWFVAKDVCHILDIANYRDAVSRLDDDEKGVATTDTLGGPQALLWINEPGLYRLIFQSRKSEAKAFTRWVTHEVLPAIRTTGTYTIQSQASTSVLKEALRERLLANVQCVPDGYFTIGSVALNHFLVLIDKFQHLDGFAMPEQSIAQCFARYAKEELHLPDEHRCRYTHVLPNGHVVQAWAYDLRYLTTFEKWLWGIYFPQRFPDYERYRARYTGLPAPKTRKQLSSPKNRSEIMQPLLWE